MTAFSPREIVSNSDRFIVGQTDAKRAVAIALRNRWRRQQLDPGLKAEVMPEKHPDDDRAHGLRQDRDRPASRAPRPGAVPEVEATKFTEVGYVGRDVEQIVRDLVEAAIGLAKEGARAEVRVAAEKAAEPGAGGLGRRECLGDDARELSAAQTTRRRARRAEIEVEIAGGQGPGLFEVPGLPPGQPG